MSIPISRFDFLITIIGIGTIIRTLVFLTMLLAVSLLILLSRVFIHSLIAILVGLTLRLRDSYHYYC